MILRDDRNPCLPSRNLADRDVWTVSEPRRHSRTRSTNPQVWCRHKCRGQHARGKMQLTLCETLALALALAKRPSAQCASSIFTDISVAIPWVTSVRMEFSDRVSRMCGRAPLWSRRHSWRPCVAARCILLQLRRKRSRRGRHSNRSRRPEGRRMKSGAATADASLWLTFRQRSKQFIEV